MGGPQAGIGPSPYDTIAELYDPWSRSVKEDVGFYVREARESGGPVVELGVGTGRIAIPIGWAGIPVIGVDSSREMLAACGRAAEKAAVSELLDLRLGDLREPPVAERVNLVTSPFRALLHMEDDEQRLQALGAARELLLPGGRLIFDVFRPSREDIEQTHARWLEREPGIWERADWDVEGRRLVLSVRGAEGGSTMALSWAEPEEWRALIQQSGFEVEGFYGWFDRRRYRGGEDSVWVARRR
jgi:SAM-dependent methyltransferase